MTIPHLMNCPHQEDGWCLDCVADLGNENMRLKQLLAERPPINSALFQNYANWTGAVYASEQPKPELIN